MLASALLMELRSIVPEDKIWEEATHDSLGNGGNITIYPTTEEEIVNTVKFANDNKKKIVITGNGTKRGFGGTAPNYDIVLSLTNYKGIVEHTVGDMTVTVKAGTTFQELQDYLHGFSQQMPLDPALPGEATIGGIIGANDSGPKRLRYGSARDMVIGLKVIYPDGKILRAGGKVVKNVAGYDMNKLYIGSMGTLGVISEITMKLRPVPSYESLLLVSFPSGEVEQIQKLVKTILDTTLEPVSLELLNPALSKLLTGVEEYTLATAFEDVKDSVHSQEETFKDLLPVELSHQLLTGKEVTSFWQQFSHLRPSGAGTYERTGVNTEASVKIGVKNMDVADIVKKASLLADLYNVNVIAHGGLGHGVCHIHLKGLPEDIYSALTSLRDTAHTVNGYAIFTHLPLEMRSKQEVWGEKQSSHFLFEGIKRKVDPKKTLNDKRFVGGI
ncbi:MAG: FAD-binding oxidoreductase [Bacillus sp. (in: Bacteria)]|nr:FAD-binding oxidoreductase [Bacillus sp. (in: firmicutes)]